MNSISDKEIVNNRKVERLIETVRAELSPWISSHPEWTPLIRALVRVLIARVEYEPSKGEIDQLRDETGAGRILCKRVLSATEGDFEIAKRNL